MRSPAFSSRPRVRLGALAASVLSACAAAGLASGCARNPRPGADEYSVADTAQTTVRVQNQGFLDANVYVLRGNVRVRLGTVTGNSTAVLTIPRSLVAVVTPLRFVSVPIGGNRAPVSEEVSVSPGDEVGIVIPPG